MSFKYLLVFISGLKLHIIASPNFLPNYILDDFKNTKAGTHIELPDDVQPIMYRTLLADLFNNKDPSQPKVKLMNNPLINKRLKQELMNNYLSYIFTYPIKTFANSKIKFTFSEVASPFKVTVTKSNRPTPTEDDKYHEYRDGTKKLKSDFEYKKDLIFLYPDKRDFMFEYAEKNANEFIIDLELDTVEDMGQLAFAFKCDEKGCFALLERIELQNVEIIPEPFSMLIMGSGIGGFLRKKYKKNIYKKA